MNYRQLILLMLGFTFVISGCSSLQESGLWFRDKANDYHEAKVTGAIEVPDTFKLQAKQEDFPVPQEVPTDKKSYEVSIVPPTAKELLKESKS